MKYGYLKQDFRKYFYDGSDLVIYVEAEEYLEKLCFVYTAEGLINKEPLAKFVELFNRMRNRVKSIYNKFKNNISSHEVSLLTKISCVKNLMYLRKTLSNFEKFNKEFNNFFKQDISLLQEEATTIETTN